MIYRQLSAKIEEWAGRYPVVTLTGPRQSGKTTLVKALFSDKPYLSLEDLDTRAFAREDPRGFLHEIRDGAVLDEVQHVPGLLSYLQGDVDRDDRPGRFILTGSQQFEMMEQVSQSLAGRTAVGRLLPFSFSELPGFAEKRQDPDEMMFTGFYPRIHDRNLPPCEALGFYVSTYLERDIRRMVNLPNLSRFENFLKLCAGRCGQLLDISGLSNELGITHPTVRSWISILEAAHVIHLLPPWHANIPKRLVKRPKLYFVDTGLACHMIGIREASQLQAHPLRGHLFENMMVAEALKQLYHQGRNADLCFFRDHKGNEVDLVHETGGGIDSYEIKFAQTVSASFFKGLEQFRSLCPQHRQAHLLCRGTTSHTRQGVAVLPWYDFSLDACAARADAVD